MQIYAGSRAIGKHHIVNILLRQMLDGEIYGCQCPSVLLILEPYHSYPRIRVSTLRVFLDILIEILESFAHFILVVSLQSSLVVIRFRTLYILSESNSTDSQ